MSMTYYTVDDLRPGRSGWGVKRFSALNDAISHYRSLPMDGARVLGIRAVFVEGAGWLSPQDVKKQRQLPLVLRYRVDGMTKDGAYLSLEVEPWEYDLLLEQTRDHYKMKKH